jgi:hypothetical protein
VIAAVATVTFRWWLGRRFWLPSKFLAMEDCIKDKEEFMQINFDPLVYLDPALNPLPPIDDRSACARGADELDAESLI